MAISNLFRKAGLVLATTAMTFLCLAQNAENLNLRTPRTKPYNSYGRLADGCPNAEKLGIRVGVQAYTFTK